MNGQINKLPENLRYWSCDEVAECLSVTHSTYEELWSALEKAHAAGKAKPIGGDGSNGTIEEPEVTSGEYDSDLVAVWPMLSDAAQKDIILGATSLP